MSDNKKGIAPTAAAIAGTIIGVAAGATAAVLSDKNNRKKVSKKLEEFRVEGQKAYTELKKRAGEANLKAQDFRKKLEAKVEEVKGETQKKLAAKKVSRKRAKKVTES